MKNIKMKNIKLLLAISLVTISSFSLKAQTDIKPGKIQTGTNTPYLLNPKETAQISPIERAAKINKAIEAKIATLKAAKTAGTLTEQDAKLLVRLERTQAQRLSHRAISTNAPVIIQKSK